MVGVICWRRVKRTEDNKVARMSGAISTPVVSLSAKFNTVLLVVVRSRLMEWAPLLLAVSPFAAFVRTLSMVSRVSIALRFNVMGSPIPVKFRV